MEKNPQHPSAILLRQAKKERDQLHEHSLENLRKQAKELLKQFEKGDQTATDRFTANHPNFPKAEICLADAQAVIAREQGHASWPKMKSSLTLATLADEVERLRRKLHSEGKDNLAPIITEESLKSAILKGMQSYESLPDEVHAKHKDSKLYWVNSVKPLLSRIIDDGMWPENAVVDICYQQTDDRGVTYDGLGASLEMRTPDAIHPGFSLAVLDLWYGRF